MNFIEQSKFTKTFQLREKFEIAQTNLVRLSPPVCQIQFSQQVLDRLVV